MPLLGDEGHAKMVRFLDSAADLIKRPDAILLISAHWEETVATITGNPRPELIYDYYGFPRESYEITYPAEGSPQLAGQVMSALSDAGVQARIDGDRGFDHGMFVPLIMMYPNADIPCVQLSLVKGLDADIHLKLGEALAPLSNQNLLVLGSGFSFHNMRQFFIPQEKDTGNIEFDEWLNRILSDPDMPWEDQYKALSNWQAAPSARYCHPREEHLLPLHVCFGMARGRGPARRVFNDTILGKLASAFLWPSS